MNALLVINPCAGQGSHEDTRRVIGQSLGTSIRDMIVTQAPGDAQVASRAATERPEIDAILVAGGDGTLNEVLTGLAQARSEGKRGLPIGLIALGTQNVMAHELGLPVHDVPALAAILKAGHVRWIDLGMCNDRPFGLMAGFGFDGAVVQGVERTVKDLIGPAAYAFATLGALARYRSTQMRLILDGDMIETDAFLVVVANVSSYAYRLVKLTPFAAIDDGWLDICVFERPRTDRVGFATQIMAVVAGRHLRDPRVRYYRAKHIQLVSDPPILAQLDGDIVGHTPAEITVLPHAQAFFVTKSPQ